MDVITAPSSTWKKWTPGTVSWEEILSWMEHPAAAKECGGYVIGKFRGGLRRTRSLIHREAVTLDADYNARSLPEHLTEMGVRCAWHTTWSSAPDNPRYRVVLPLSRPVSAEEYEIVAESLAARCDPEAWDRTSFRPAQFMWRPAAKNRDWYSWGTVDGPPVDVDAILADPQTAPRPGLRRKPQKRDPLQIEGVVGAFNRAYPDLDELISVFDLPYVKEGEGVWRYAPSHSTAGMGAVAGFPHVWYSHHATDPACGLACSAFDLVRVHVFGEEDLGTKESTPVNRLPSHKAMEEFAARDMRVRAELAGMAFGEDVDPSLGDGLAADMWRLDLKVDRSGKPLPTVANLDLLLENDVFFKRLRFDLLKNQIVTETLDPFPWGNPRSEHGLREGDYLNARDYLEREYGLSLPKERVSDLVKMAADSKQFNPLQSRLRSLKWDGVPRLETCLPALKQDEYTAFAARVLLLGAVNRALNPGCKSDYSLILYGREGLGKTQWVHAMAMEPRYTAELGDIRNKDTGMKMSGHWIMVADEVHALRQAQFDQLKDFLTQTYDTFRAPYDREVKQHPRSTVVWGTTNEKKFLRQQEGNRRFLMIECGKIPRDKMDPGYVEQVWAEAVFLLETGADEDVYLSEEEEDVARARREEFTQEEPLVGLVSDYLNMPVPEDWDMKSTEERRQWVSGDRYLSPGQGLQNVVSSLHVWYEVLEGRGSIPEKESRAIRAALEQIPGWEPAGVRNTFYGPQQCFVRVSNSVAPDADLL